jgi:hypothetical protein
MKRKMMAWAGSIALLCWVNIDNATAQQFDVNRGPIALRFSMAGQVTGVRYSEQEDFWPVEQGMAKGIVAGLPAHPRPIPVDVYLVRSEDDRLWMRWHFWPFCIWFLKPIDQIRGDILVDIDLSDGNARVEFPDGQVVTVSQEGEIDWGGGEEFRSGDFREELATGLSIEGYRHFTLFEFVANNQIVSRNVAVVDVGFD